MTEAKDYIFQSTGKEFTPTYKPGRTAKATRKLELEEMSRQSLDKINKTYGKGIVKKRVVIVDKDLKTHVL